MKKKPTKASKSVGGAKINVKKLKARRKSELLGKRQPNQKYDDFATAAKLLRNSFDTVRMLQLKFDPSNRNPKGASMVDKLAYEDDDGPVTVRQELAENLSKFRADFGGLAVFAAINGDANFFTGIASAIERRADRRHQPDITNLALMEAMLGGAGTAYKAAQEVGGDRFSHDDNQFENLKKRARRIAVTCQA